MADGGNSSKGGQVAAGTNPYNNAAQGMQGAFNMIGQAANQTQDASQGYNPAMTGGYGNYNASMMRTAGLMNPAIMGAHGKYDAARMGTHGNYNAATGQGASYNAARQRGPEQIRQLMGDYQNPYEDQVVRSTSNEVMRNLQQSQMSNADAAAAAGAFGGGRHGLVEATTNAEALRDIGDLTGQLRAQGFDTSAGLAGQDVANRMDVRSQNQAAINAGRQFNTGNRQQMRLANMDARNTARQFNQGNRQQRLLANQAAENAQRQFNQDNRQQRLLANQGSRNAARQFNQGNLQDMRMFNQTNRNAQRQFNQGNRQQSMLANQASRNAARQFNAQAGQDAASQYESLANSLGNLSQASYGMGRDITGQQSAQGGMAQQLMQQILGQGGQQFDEQTSSPEQLLQMRLASLGMNPMSNATTTTTQSNPGWGGLFGNLIGAAGNALQFSPITLSSLRYKSVTSKTGKKIKSTSGKIVDQVEFVYNEDLDPNQQVHLGVVAEDLGPDDPAVVVDAYGRPDRVDYSKLEVI